MAAKAGVKEATVPCLPGDVLFSSLCPSGQSDSWELKNEGEGEKKERESEEAMTYFSAPECPSPGQESWIILAELQEEGMQAEEV